MSHRLYHRIFGSLLLFVGAALLLAALAGHLFLSHVVQTRIAEHLAAKSRSVASSLAPGRGSDGELQRALERVAAEERVQAALWSADGRRLAFTSVDLPPPIPGAGRDHWLAARGGPALAVALGDGTTLVVQPHRVPRPLGFLLTLGVLAAVLAAACHPVARRLTRRLEALEAGVRSFGEGDLGRRVALDGDDELASLAGTFNRSAERLERLIEAQRRVLASASHELRSPLARLRMALELARDEPEAAATRLDQAVEEVAELDLLVEELLLAGRLEVSEPTRPAEPVDVAPLLAAEAARVGAAVRVPDSLPARVEPRLLRVLLSNLLENARRHGQGGPIEAGAEPLPGGAGVRLWVADHGPGVAESERERIFEPFYRPLGHAEEKDGGVGLGLYLVRRIARSHGGDATCGPREGGGTRFEVTLVEQ